MLPKGKSQAKKSAITLPDKEQMTIEMEQSHQSNATWFQHNGYFSMTLDDVEEPNFGNRDQGNDHHQAAPEDINLPEPYQYNMDPPNRDERFDVGDDETQPNVTPADYGQFPPVFIPSPPPRDDPKRVEDRHPIPEHPRMRPHDDNMNAREESEKRRPAKRKRVKPIQMDREQIVIAAPTYQSWLQDPSALVSKRGGMIKTAPTQTQGKANHPSDELTKSIHDQMKKHFDCPGAPQYESLDALTTDMTRKKAALLFYQTCVLATRDVLRVKQEVPYGEIIISRGSKM
ncbi:hypothetical protein P8452_44319 [Trifolium repens]|nr:hypothetical protein P8452_44319 [Trifolium repens]